jgi:hypothetical protein
MAKELQKLEWKKTEGHCPVYTVLIATLYTVLKDAHETLRAIEAVKRDYLVVANNTERQ